MPVSMLAVPIAVAAARPRHVVDCGPRWRHPRLALGQEHGPHGNSNRELSVT